MTSKRLKPFASLASRASASWSAEKLLHPMARVRPAATSSDMAARVSAMGVSSGLWSLYMSTLSTPRRSRLAVRAFLTFSGSLPVPTLVQRVISSRHPRARIQRPMIFSDELISMVASRTSSVP